MSTTHVLTEASLQAKRVAIQCKPLVLLLRRKSRSARMMLTVETIQLHIHRAYVQHQQKSYTISI